MTAKTQSPEVLTGQVQSNTQRFEDKSFSVKDEDFKKADPSWGLVQNCVFVARKPEGVAIRDSKDASKTTLFFTNDEWKAFITGVKDGEFEV